MTNPSNISDHKGGEAGWLLNESSAARSCARAGAWAIVMYGHPTGLKVKGTRVSRGVFEVSSLPLALAPSDDEG